MPGPSCLSSLEGILNLASERRIAVHAGFHFSNDSRCTCALGWTILCYLPEAPSVVVPVSLLTLCCR